MRVSVVLEHRFIRTPDRNVWTDGPFPYSFFTRYLTTFDGVSVVARVREADTSNSNWRRAGGEAVSFSSVPYYVGPGQYLVRAPQVRSRARQAVGRQEAVILRVPSQVATCAESVLRSTNQPYGVEVVGDPYDAFSPGTGLHPLRGLFRRRHCRRLKDQCARASAAAYVTGGTLKKRYPPAPETFTATYSSVELPEEFLAAQPRRFDPGKRSFRLISVGSLDHLYKAPDVLIDAVGECVRRGWDLELALVGGGRRRATLERHAGHLGLAKRVCFLGQLPSGEAVGCELDRADLFVLPSRQEGLPRAMIEAMARGLPCIGSRVGGIPELLDRTDLVDADDVGGLAGKISEVLSDPRRLRSMSVRNWRRAGDYLEDALRPKRDRFYRYLRTRTEQRLQATAG